LAYRSKNFGAPSQKKRHLGVTWKNPAGARNLEKNIGMHNKMMNLGLDPKILGPFINLLPIETEGQEKGSGCEEIWAILEKNWIWSQRNAFRPGSENSLVPILSAPD